MYRFVAFSWNSKDSQKTATARRLGRLLLSTSPDLQCVLDVRGLRVFHAPQPRSAYDAYVLARDTGVVLGKLFDGSLDEDSISSDPTFDDKESKLVIESRGRRLVERYWGHYVAFLREPQGERRFVFRDPTGALPCFLVKAAGIDVIVSDMEDCVRLNLTPFTIDWDHLTAYLHLRRMVTRTTGLKEVTLLHAGECTAFDDGAMTPSFHWSPADVYAAGSIEDPDEARAALRAIIRHCVKAWASCYDGIVHRLSGGLDSSIIAACLGKGSVRPDVLCLNYFTETSEGEERRYARAAAISAECELIESKLSASESRLESRWDTSRVATPLMLGVTSPPELLLQRVVTERHAGAVFSGQGGDHLFQQAKSNLLAAEYAHRNGIRPRLLNVARDTSRLTHESMWSVFAATVRHGLLRHPIDPYKAMKPPAILSEDARTSFSPHAYAHPWVKNSSGLPAAKTKQVQLIVGCQIFYLESCPYADLIHPLISQPIIERCLQIPSYVLAHRGRARGLVRDAFEADVPAKIINRYSKGATTSYSIQMLIENAVYLRELLLDGVLIREGILDRRELEKQLSERELMRGKGLSAVLCTARAETWLSTWADVRQRTAA